MAALVVTKGLPAAGKTSRMRAWVAEESDRRCRVNRDDLRAMMFGGWSGLGPHEAMVSQAQRAAVTALLNAGFDVGVDDTNLNPEHMQVWERIAAEVGARLEVWDMTDVPVDTCIARDCVRLALGERYVGEKVIRDMYERWLAPAAEPCDCEAYGCTGQCCGVGNCTCTPDGPGEVVVAPASTDLLRQAALAVAQAVLRDDPPFVVRIPAGMSGCEARGNGTTCGLPPHPVHVSHNFDITPFGHNQLWPGRP